jgi:hypothetical protein
MREPCRASRSVPQVSPRGLALCPLGRAEGQGRDLAGYAPSESDKADLLETARRVLGDVPVTDQVSYGSGAPDGFVTAAEAAMDAASRLAGGRAEMTDTKIKVSGEVFFQNAMQEVEAAVAAAVPDGYTLDLAIMTRQIGQPLTPAQCRDRLQAISRPADRVRGGKVRPARHEPQPARPRGRDAARCGDVGIEVAAHADPTGPRPRTAS